MIINKTLVSFAGRTPSPRYVPVGVVGDNLVECVEFRLPTIDADQTATMLLKCKYADAITLTRTDTMTYCADITAQIAGESGKFEAYIRIDGAGGAVWNSEPFMLCVCNVPDISGDVEDREPGALEQTLSAIAAHNAAIKQHSEDMEETAEAASESAENAEESAGRAEAAAKRAEEISEPYTLPVATADTLGGVKVGNGFELTNDGTLNPLYRGMQLIRSFVVSEDVEKLTVDRDANNKPFELTCALFHIVCAQDVAEGHLQTGAVTFASVPKNYFARGYAINWVYPGTKISETYTRTSSLRMMCDIRDGVVRISGSHGDEGTAGDYAEFIREGQLKYAPNVHIVEVRADFFVPKNAKIYLYGVRKVNTDA